MQRTCKRCGVTLTGPGAHNAVLCLPHWAELLARIEHGERNCDLANEYGVRENLISIKRMMYGRDHEQQTA